MSENDADETPGWFPRLADGLGFVQILPGVRPAFATPESCWGSGCVPRFRDLAGDPCHPAMPFYPGEKP